MDENDDLPQRKAPQKLDLDPMSIDEMREYIVALESEIERIKGEIEKKQRHREGIEGLFKS